MIKHRDQPIKCRFCLHIETSQLICTANPLTGFCMRSTEAFNGLTRQWDCLLDNVQSWSWSSQIADTKNECIYRIMRKSGKCRYVFNTLSNIYDDGTFFLETVKGCVRQIFASLFCKFKREHLWNKEKCFLFHIESSFRSWDNQVLTFQILKSCDFIKCRSLKHETHFTE